MSSNLATTVDTEERRLNPVQNGFCLLSSLSSVVESWAYEMGSR